MSAAETQKVTLRQALRGLSSGEYVIPSFQRDFVWRHEDIVELMRSIFNRYYLGSLLLWDSTDKTLDDLECRPIFGRERGSSDKKRPWIVLDGQQRMTSIYYAIFAPDVNLRDRAQPSRYFLDIELFISETPDDPGNEAAIFGGTIQDELAGEEAYQRHRFPLRLLSNDSEREAWIAGYENYWKTIGGRNAEESGDFATMAEEYADDGNDAEFEEAVRERDAHAEKAAQAREHQGRADRFRSDLIDLLASFDISYIRLGQDLETTAVVDIFTQINRQGTKLEPVDYLYAQLTMQGLNPKVFARDEIERLEDAGLRQARTDADIARIMLLKVHPEARTDPDLFTALVPGRRLEFRDRGKQALIGDAEEFKGQWIIAAKALHDGRRSLMEMTGYEDYKSKKAPVLPFEGMIPAYCALFDLVRNSAKGQNRLLQWYWASMLSARYSRADSEMLRSHDYQDVHRWLHDGPEPPSVTEFKDHFGFGSLQSAPMSSQQRERVVMAAMAALNPRCLSTGEMIDRADLVRVPIISLPWLEQQEEALSEFNWMFLDRATAEKLDAEDMPLRQYLIKSMTQHDVHQREAILDSHCISLEAYAQIQLETARFEKSNYIEFIKLRELAMLHSVGRIIFDQVPLAVDPTKRILEREITDIEERLHKLIRQRLNDDARVLHANMPGGLSKRIARLVNENPSRKNEFMQSLETMLSVADLRELDELFRSNKHWGKFKAIFGSKDELQMRFRQLAGLRNTDVKAHPRPPTKIEIDDGTAAIRWFKSQLSRADDLQESGELDDSSEA